MLTTAMGFTEFGSNVAISLVPAKLNLTRFPVTIIFVGSIALKLKNKNLKHLFYEIRIF